MSEAARYEKLLLQIQALEARVQAAEKRAGTQWSEGDALARWQDFLTKASIPTIGRTWREIETSDLHAACVGLSPQAIANLKQSLSKNAWVLLVDDLQAKHLYFLAHSARVRILGIVEQLEQLGEIVWDGAPEQAAGKAFDWKAAERSFEDWKRNVLEPLA